MTSSPEPGTGEHAHEILMSQADRDAHDRELQAAAEERTAAAEGRLASLEQHAATVGRDIFGRALSPDQLARATAALDLWYDPGPGGYRAPGLTWGQAELDSMHAALEAPTTGAALQALGIAPGSPLSTTQQDTRNRAAMTELRKQLPSPQPTTPGDKQDQAEQPPAPAAAPAPPPPANRS